MPAESSALSGERAEILPRIATLDGVQPSALRELNEVLTKLLTGNENVKKKPMGGVRAAAEILNYLSGENEASVMANLKNYDGEMAQKIMDEMFVFDNVIDIDDRGIQLLLAFGLSLFVCCDDRARGKKFRP